MKLLSIHNICSVLVRACALDHPGASMIIYCTILNYDMFIIFLCLVINEEIKAFLPSPPIPGC